MNKKTWEVFGRLCGIRVPGLKGQHVLQCAPLLAGMKPASLLTTACGSPVEAGKLLSYADIRSRTLFSDERLEILFLYREEALEALLQNTEVARAMRMFGYVSLGREAVFLRLCSRYRRYMRTQEDFPHELGLLLGYPVGDVLGFVRNRGENYLYNGYWKVYGNVSEAKKTFAGYAKAEEWLLRLAAAQAARAAL